MSWYAVKQLNQTIKSVIQPIHFFKQQSIDEKNILYLQISMNILLRCIEWLETAQVLHFLIRLLTRESKTRRQITNANNDNKSSYYKWLQLPGPFVV